LAPELRAEIIAAGIPPERVDLRVLRFKNRAIRKGGVPDLNDYIREQIPLWVTWELEEEAKRRAGNGPSSADATSPRPEGPARSENAPARRSEPKWIHADHVHFARVAGLDLRAEARRFRATWHHGPRVLDGMHACDLYAPFLAHLRTAAAEKAAA
jgi:hypothetical protein